MKTRPLFWVIGLVVLVVLALVLPIFVKLRRYQADQARIGTTDLVKHRNGRGAAAEAITGKVISAQSLKVDTISGATMSSKVILLAIESALKGR
jgi:uncharacterized protein with FMN-binding domain